MYHYLPVKYVTESRRNISVHLFQSHRPEMGEEELKHERINKLISERKLRQVWWKPETSWNVKWCIICSEKRTVYRERSSKKTVNYEEQIMSRDKYPNIFWRQIEAIVFIIPRLFFQARAVCLDQSRARENIWWIIKCHMRSFWPIRMSNSCIHLWNLPLEIILKWHIPPRFFPHYPVLARNWSKSYHCSPSFT